MCELTNPAVVPGRAVYQRGVWKGRRGLRGGGGKFVGASSDGWTAPILR